ncbi:hypothetical protein [Sphingomonas sp. PB4P5]|uniref:hypothetical protein n=1 Tax=Parasphingomonas puruogangriensis TaxID=3096155 RepID=UPI002FCBB900
MADVIKVTVTNMTAGPKIFNGVTPALLHPGQETGPLEVNEAELKSMRSTGYFTITGGPAEDDDKPVALTGKNKAELLDIAKAENVTIEEGATNADIVSAIELAREDAAKA